MELLSEGEASHRIGHEPSCFFLEGHRCESSDHFLADRENYNTGHEKVPQNDPPDCPPVIFDVRYFLSTVPQNRPANSARQILIGPFFEPSRMNTQIQ